MQSIKIRFYTVSLRLIREVVYEPPASDLIMTRAGNNRYLDYATNQIQTLASGIYFYCILVDSDEGEIRSDVGKLIVLH